MILWIGNGGYAILIMLDLTDFFCQCEKTSHCHKI